MRISATQSSARHSHRIASRGAKAKRKSVTHNLFNANRDLLNANRDPFNASGDLGNFVRSQHLKERLWPLVL